MMNKMIVSNLAHRPVRSAITIVAIALEVALILLIVGLSIGMLNDSRSRQAGIGADIIVLPPGSSNIVGITGAPMPIKIADLIRPLPHVAVVSPVLIQISAGGGRVQNIWGIDLPSFEALRPFTYLKGGPFEQPDDALVDDVYANGEHVSVGQNIDILNQRFRVSGIVAHGRGARIFLPLAKLQDVNGAPGRASAFYIKADDPARMSNVISAIKAIPHMETYGIHSMQEYLSFLTTDNVPMLSTFIRVVIGIAVTIGVIVIFQAMYAAVAERTREIGILKSIGASKAYIVNVILRETVLLAVLGILVGIAVSFIAKAGMHQRLPTLPVEFTSRWLVQTIVIALIGAIGGAIYPAFKAAQKDPIDALAYE